MSIDMEDTMRTPFTDYIRSRRAAIAGTASFCEQCSSVRTARGSYNVERERARFDLHRTDLFR